MIRCLKVLSVFIISSLWVQPIIIDAQSTIKGTLLDEAGAPMKYATVILNKSKDGSVTDELGNFSFQTFAKGADTLVASSLGYEATLYDLNLQDSTYTLTIKLFKDATELEDVVITAGSIEANNENNVAVLKPLDIVTTAGGLGDITGALQTLPGVQRNGGDQTGLMVRGGDVNESIVIIDGSVAQNAYFSSVPGVSQRNRFNPFLFKGLAFSSGGYSAKYGQALSSILDLQTNDLPEEDNLTLGVNFSGLSVSGAKLMKNNALEYTANYLNVTPFYRIAKTNIKLIDPPVGGGFSTRWISKIGEKGIFKMNFQNSFNKTLTQLPNPESYFNKINFGIKNENTFFNASYKNWITRDLLINGSLSFSSNADNILWDTTKTFRDDSKVQGRFDAKYHPNSKLELLIGSEIQRIKYAISFGSLAGRYEETLNALYVESEWKPKKKIGIKTGVRGEHSLILGKYNVAPRFSMAYKTGVSSQISFASGIFHQTIPTQYLLLGYRSKFQRAFHYMFNYQWMKSDRTFRIEGYYKSYDRLVKENAISYNPNQYRFDYGQVTASGTGYAQGIDIFWRDKKSIKNFDYWISYSYIDTKRIYQNYPTLAKPDYVSPNNFNIVSKYFVEKLQMSFSLSYNYATGRSYYNKNAASFLSDRTKDYHNIAVNASFLTTIKKIFIVVYLSVDNITNQKNILGYRYSADGLSKAPILPPLYRSIFIGANFSLTKFKKEEL